VPKLVFDTHYFRGLKPPVLEELRRRKFILSISYTAFVEAWNRSLEDDKPGLFFGPARNFAPYVDPNDAIAPSGGELFVRLGAQPPPGKKQNAAKFREWAALCWKHAVTSNSGDPFYRAHGAHAQAALAAVKRNWLRMAKKWTVRMANVSKREHLRSLRILTEVDPKRLERAMWRWIREAHPPRGMNSPGPSERAHAYLRVVSRQLLATGRGGEMAAANDAEDFLQLSHVSEGAIFVTRERKILRLVDACGTFQAPWVRTLAEVLTDRLPRGRPWGRHARRVAALFKRRPYDELRDQESSLLRSILDAHRGE
jgi:hypothetical protein